MTDDLHVSTDDRRTAGRLPHLNKLALDGPVSLELGGELPGVEVAYETWGQLNDERSNAVLVCHAISGDPHAASDPDDPDDPPGWWDELIGPGRPIDTDRWYVVCSNVLGGCRGTTGPGSPRKPDPQKVSGTFSGGEEDEKVPDTFVSGGEQPYGPDFPDITLGDIVDVQARLADALGVERWAAVVGGSLGGHQALVWATRYPQRVARCIAMATSPRLNSQALAFDVIGRNAIQRDPHFADGRYYDRPDRPDAGLAIARMLGHITYLSAEAMDAKFDPDRHRPRDIQTAFEKRFSVGSYLAHQGQKFVQRFDANSYITLSTAMDLLDLGRSPEQLQQTLSAGGSGGCRWLLLSFSSDWLFPPSQSRQIVDALCRLDQRVSYCEITTDAGHDAFLLPEVIQRYGPLVRGVLEADALGEGVGAPPTPEGVGFGDEAVSRDPVSIYHPDRLDYETVLEFIEPGASVLDLGCGRGGLLARLAVRDASVAGPRKLTGLEIAHDNIVATASRGLDVLDIDLNGGLPMFGDGQFDVVVLSMTLQAIDDVRAVLREMVRVGRRAIVSFPNFGWQPLRQMLFEGGRSPKAPGPYAHDWWNTPNRRFPTILDVHDLCRDAGIAVRGAAYLETATGRRIGQDEPYNQLADTAVLLLERDGRG